MKSEHLFKDSFKTRDALKILGMSRSLFIEATRETIKGAEVNPVVKLKGSGQGSQRDIGFFELCILGTIQELHEFTGIPIPQMHGIGSLINNVFHRVLKESETTLKKIPFSRDFQDRSIVKDQKGNEIVLWKKWSLMVFRNSNLNSFPILQYKEFKRDADEVKMEGWKLFNSSDSIDNFVEELELPFSQVNLNQIQKKVLGGIMKM